MITEEPKQDENNTPLNIIPEAVLKMDEVDINEKGIALIKEYEGFRTKAYKCSAGRWTIGYGHMILPTDDFAKLSRDTYKKHITLSDVIGATRELTKKECEALLKQDLKVFCDAVREAVKGKATQGQFNAMVSLAYNIGINAFKSSSVVKYHNRGDCKNAGEWFLAWRNATIRGVKKPILLPRRRKEKAVYDKG